MAQRTSYHTVYSPPHSGKGCDHDALSEPSVQSTESATMQSTGGTTQLHTACACTE